MKIKGIYKIECKTSKKIYVGSSIDIIRRIKEHKRKLNLGQHYNPHLQNSYNKYGKDDFIFTSLEEIDYDITRKDLNKLEYEWIKKLKTDDSNYGFNIQYPKIKDNLGHTKESKQRLSHAMKESYKRRLKEKYPNGFTLINVKDKPVSFHNFYTISDLKEFLKNNIDNYDNKTVSRLKYNNSYRGYILSDINKRGCDYLFDIMNTKDFNIPPKQTQFEGHEVIVNNITFNTKTEAAEYIGISVAHLSRIIKNNSEFSYRDYFIKVA